MGVLHHTSALQKYNLAALRRQRRVAYADTAQVYHAVVFGHPPWDQECELSTPLQGKHAETRVKAAWQKSAPDSCYRSCGCFAFDCCWMSEKISKCRASFLNERSVHRAVISKEVHPCTEYSIGQPWSPFRSFVAAAGTPGYPGDSKACVSPLSIQMNFSRSCTATRSKTRSEALHCAKPRHDSAF